MEPDIWVIGSINMDLVIRADHIPSPGETVRGSELQLIPGGKGANQAVAIARLGGEVGMFGRIGADPFGAGLRENLIREGIMVDHVEILEDTPTGVALIVLDAGGQNSIVVAPGANGKVLWSEVLPVMKGWQGVGFLVMQLEIPLQTVSKAAREAKKRGVKVILNAAPGNSAVSNWMDHVDFLVVNESEAEILSNRPVRNLSQAEDAARLLLELGAPVVVITLGGQGALLATEEGLSHFPAPEVEVVDTTAAGDAFIGGFTVALQRRWSLEEALGFACCAGALAVSRFGAQPSLPTFEEVMNLCHWKLGGEI